jgi:hypothetical protein
MRTDDIGGGLQVDSFAFGQTTAHSQWYL